MIVQFIQTLTASTPPPSKLRLLVAYMDDGLLVINDMTNPSKRLPVINNTIDLSQELPVINNTTDLSKKLPVINNTTNLSKGLLVINNTSVKITYEVVCLFGL